MCFNSSARIRNPSPPACTMTSLGDISLPMNADNPTIPSLPMVATSMALPSAMTIMADGSAIEVATIGNEGMVGLSAFIGSEISPNEVMVQAGGEGLRMRADELKHMANQDGSLRQALVLYHHAF